MALVAAVLATSPQPSTAQSVGFHTARAKTLRSASDQAHADLTAAQVAASSSADAEAAATEVLTAAENLNNAALQESLDDMSAALADAKYDVVDASRTLNAQERMLAEFQANPGQHPAIPAAKKAISDAQRRVRMTQMLLDEWTIVIAEANSGVKEAQKAYDENRSTATEAALTEAQVLKQEVDEVFPDMVGQAERAKRRLARAQAEYEALMTAGAGSADYFQLAVEDAKVDLAAAQEAYNSAKAAVERLKEAVRDFSAIKSKGITEARAALNKAKTSRAVADKKVLQLADRAKAAEARAAEAEKAAAAAGPKA